MRTDPAQFRLFTLPPALSLVLHRTQGSVLTYSVCTPFQQKNGEKVLAPVHLAKIEQRMFAPRLAFAIVFAKSLAAPGADSCGAREDCVLRLGFCEVGMIVLKAGVWVEVLVLSSVAFGNTGCKDAMDSSIEGDMLDDSGGQRCIGTNQATYDNDIQGNAKNMNNSKKIQTIDTKKESDAGWDQSAPLIITRAHFKVGSSEESLQDGVGLDMKNVVEDCFDIVLK
ncbi:hypothetical protein F5H01DRAFT_316393 [Linnemannia elongata]|nr:hypothetical protein F5H01DRAFT_316393 [Linnemannia elongata]